MTRSASLLSQLLAVATFAAALPCAAQAPPPKAAPAPAPSAPTVPSAPVQPGAAAQAAAPPDDPVALEARKQQARAHFEKGFALVKQNAFRAALAEFLESRALYPTRTATQNAGLTLQRLERYDEALDLFETLLREFPNIPNEDKAITQHAIIELRALVGTVDVQGAEAGAQIVIDGRERGDYPPPSPLRVAAGPHVLRLYKEGFEPFEARVDVAGGDSVRAVAKLRPLTSVGRLKVTESGGRRLDVVLDGVVVGKTPWSGDVAVGEHAVSLRGEGLLGSPPASAPVHAQQMTALNLSARELDASLRVEPTPVGATVAIDAVVVGRGFWEGRLVAGTHRVEVAADGFLTQTHSVTLERGEQSSVAMQLSRDRDAKLWQRPPHFELEADVAFAGAPTFGGDVSSSCGSTCSAGNPNGVILLAHGAYRFPQGFGVGVTGGYVDAAEGLSARPTAFVPVGLPTHGTASDDLRLSAFLIGATVSYAIGDALPVLMRLGGGFSSGSMRDARTGSFTTTSGAPYTTGEASISSTTTFGWFAPELTVGYRLSPRVEIGVGMQALVLAAVSQSRWQKTALVHAAADGVGTYPEDTLSGSLIVFFTPGLHARFSF